MFEVFIFGIRRGEGRTGLDYFWLFFMLVRLYVMVFNIIHDLDLTIG